MILIENLPFGSPDTTDLTSPSSQGSYQNFESPNQPPPFVDLTDIDQLISGDIQKTSAYNNQDQLFDYFGQQYEEEEENEDLRFLELDISDCSSQDQFEDDLSSLTPSVQRLFCHTSMSNYSSASSIYTTIFDDLGTKLHESVGVDNHCATSQKPNNTSNKSAYSSFGAAFDYASSYGSASSTSSTPSTPSSTIGAFNTLPQTSASSSSSTLPSFNEIYSPRYNKPSHNQLNNHGADIFKFEEYISESESISGSDSDNNSALHRTTPTVGPIKQIEDTGSVVFHSQIVPKEEPIDSFLPTTAPSSCNTPVESSYQADTPLASYCKFNERHPMLLKQNSFCQSPPINDEKMEEDQKEEAYLFTADSPKPMRYHLHNLSLNLNAIESTSGDSTPYQQTFENIDSQSTTGRIDSTVVGPFESSSTSHSPNQMMQLSSPATSISSMMQSTNHPMDESILIAENSMGYRSNKSRNQRNKSNQIQICAVCGDVAACQHYGVITCEGCKGFFKRTVQKGSKYTCLGNKDCTVDKRRRNRCQFCRFQKCLAVGMVKEVVRTDSLKGRRGRLPSKPKSPQEQSMSPPMSTITALVRAHLDTSADKANLDFSQYNDSIVDKNQMDQQIQDYTDCQMLCLLNSSLDTVHSFMEKIPGFNELNACDQRLLFQNSCLELFALRMAYRLKPGSNYIMLCNNIVLHRNQFAVTFGEWLPIIEELSHQLHAMDIDISAFACLCALTVISGRHGLQDLNKIDQLETKIINSLRDHTIYNSEAQKKCNYFSRILSKLSELRTIGEIGLRVTMQQLQKLSFSQASPEIQALERKISPNIISVIEPNVTQSIGISNSNTVSPISANNNNNIQSCLDLPSISSFFKTWPQIK